MFRGLGVECSLSFCKLLAAGFTLMFLELQLSRAFLKLRFEPRQRVCPAVQGRLLLATGLLAILKPGLFRTAFSVPDNLDGRDSAGRAGPSGRTPFQLLADALDGLVEAGVLPPDRRPGAEFLAWSAVHGLGTLLIDGPLRAVDDEQAQEIGRRLVEMVDKGL